MTTYTSLNITRQYRVRINILDTFPGVFETEAADIRSLGSKINSFFYHNDIEDFAIVSGTPASSPYIEFWAYEFDIARKVAQELRDIINNYKGDIP